MTLVIRINDMMKRRKVTNGALARAIGITESNMSLLKNGYTEGIRFDRLEALCRHLDCQPADLLVYAPDIHPDNEVLARKSAKEKRRTIPEGS